MPLKEFWVKRGKEEPWGYCFIGNTQKFDDSSAICWSKFERYTGLILNPGQLVKVRLRILPKKPRK